VVATAPPAVRTERSKRPPAPPPPPPPPPPAPKLTRISDGFADGMVDQRNWYTFVTGTSSTIGERSGRLELTIGAGAVAGGQYNLMSAQAGTKCRFPGDFDARVEYELLRWPAANGVRVELDAFLRDSGVNVGRVSDGSSEGYSSWLPPHNATVGTTDARGRLRLRRSAGLLTTYFWSRSRWIKLDAARVTGAANLALQAVASPNNFGKSDVHVAFDNFVVETPAAVC
jgi:hypothetical protein